MRGQDVERGAGQALGQELGEDAQGPGVDDGGRPTRRRTGGRVAAVSAIGVLGPASRGADERGAQDGSQFIGPGGVGGVDPRSQNECLAASGSGDDLGAGRQDEVLHTSGGSQAHHAGSGAYRAAGGQDGRTGVGLAAGPQADDAAGVLVVVGARLGKGPYQVVAQAPVDGSAGNGPARGRGQPEGDDLDGAAQVPGRR